MRIKILYIIFFIAFLSFPKLIYAYIDLGTGSYIIQLIIAAFISISLVIKIFWTKMKTFFTKILKKTKHLNE